MNLNVRDRRALVLGGVALALIGLYFLGIGPAWSWYDRLADEHAARSAQWARAVSNEHKANRYRRQLAEWQERAGPLSAPKPYDEQMTTLSQRLITCAQENSLQIKGSTPSPPTVWADDPDLRRASILIEAEGDWENIFKFIASLYRTEGVLSVEQLDLSVNPGQADKIAVRMTVSFLVKASAESSVAWSY